MNPPPSHPIRVGMITIADLDNPNPISGMPFRMAQSLREQGIEIIPIPAWDTCTPDPDPTQRTASRVIRIYRKRIPMWIRRTLDNLFPERTRSAVLNRVNSLSRNTQKNLDTLLEQGEHLHALFGCCISSAIYQLDTDIPIVYFSDATSKTIQTTYPVLALRGSSFRDAIFEVEKASVAQIAAAVFAAPTTQQSAINDLGLPPKKTHVIAMGAHVYPSDPDSVLAPASPPTREKCNLLIVAADPIRKRVDLATKTAELLCDRGINAKLFVIGKGTKNSRKSKATESVGPLKLSDPNDRARHQSLLRDCHLQLLPSLGEAFGIAPCESAHFARPSLVANAGGLPFVIRDGETGIVLDVNADAKAWADAVESLIDNPGRYRDMSIAALDRARNELNWRAWGASIRSIIDEQIARRPSKADSKGPNSLASPVPNSTPIG